MMDVTLCVSCEDGEAGSVAEKLSRMGTGFALDGSPAFVSMRRVEVIDEDAEATTD